MEYLEMKKQLVEWVESLRYAKYTDSSLYMKEYVNDGKIKISLYTDINHYIITACCSKGEDYSYLGCIVNARKPRAGEDWVRGNDLPDGRFSVDVWRSILRAIVGYELVKIQKPTKYVCDSL